MPNSPVSQALAASSGLRLLRRWNRVLFITSFPLSRSEVAAETVRASRLSGFLRWGSASLILKWADFLPGRRSKTWGYEVGMERPISGTRASLWSHELGRMHFKMATTQGENPNGHP